MVTQSSTSTAVLAVGILAATLTQAHLSTLPQRHRIGIDAQQQQPRAASTSAEKKTRQKDVIRKLMEESLSMPSLDQASFDLLSMPITESRFDLSMSISITLSEFDSSMSLSMSEFPETIVIDPQASDEKGNTVVLASFLAGIGVFVIAAAALLVKMRRVRTRRAEETRQSNEQNAQAESFATYDDMEDPEDGLNLVKVPL
jgi:hypothetical protein